jgi:hypothetical protein
MEHKPTPWVVGGARFPSASAEDAFWRRQGRFADADKRSVDAFAIALRMGSHSGRREMVDCTIPLERS